MRRIFDLGGALASKASEGMHKCATKLFEVSENMKVEEEKLQEKKELEKEFVEVKEKIISKLLEQTSSADILDSIEPEWERLLEIKNALDLFEVKPATCKKCGAPTGESAAYCTACGNKL